MQLRLALVIAFMFAGFAPSAQGAAIVNAVETGGDVVFTASGDLNLEAWTFSTILEDFGRIQPNTGVFRVGPVSSVEGDFYIAPNDFLGPSNFGTGASANGTSGSGGLLGLIPGGQSLLVPRQYNSGDPLSSSTTYSGQTFASLGLDVGSFTWTWGSESTVDSLTLNIVPEPSTATLMTLGLIGLAARRRRH
jgi:hypothetical protein